MRTFPLPPRWTILHAAIALGLAAAISSCGTVDKAMGHEPSPFRLFGRDDMRAGMKFADLEEAAKRESRRPFNRYNCWDTLPKQKMRMCKLTIEPGYLFALAFTPSAGTVVEINGANAKGWAARATHPYLGQAVCVVYGGVVSNPPSAGQMGPPSGPGMAVCDPG